MFLIGNPEIIILLAARSLVCLRSKVIIIPDVMVLEFDFEFQMFTNSFFHSLVVGGDLVCLQY